ncbi:MAG: S-layer homology domain-containing protein [Tissierellia bacterium]|nr:S-layer homology domain-containing protein [Tissierellia bacterium]
MEFRRRFLRTVALVLTVIMIMPSMPAFAATFKDVPSTHWAYSYIEDMSKQGAISGYPEGVFKPKETLTYLETMQLLSKLLDMSATEVNESKTRYSKVVEDLKVPQWAQEAVMKCIYEGVISEAELKQASSLGMITVGTNKRVRRLDVAVYMAKAMGLEKEANSKPFVVLTYKDLKDIKSDYHKLIYVLVETGVLSVSGTGNGYFEPASPLLREQMAKMMSTAFDYLNKNPQTPVNPEVPKETDTNVVVGTIRSITKVGTNSSIAVELKTGSLTYFLIDTLTAIRLDGKLATSSSIFEGQTVEVTVKNGSTTAIRVDVETLESKIEGTIKSVTPITNRITIEYKDGNSNRTAELLVINNADIELDGANASLKDLNQGDKVTLYIENNSVVEIDATKMSGRIKGIIAELDSDVKSRETIDYITVETAKDVKVEYELDEDVDIYRNGKRAEFKDLRPGDEVVIEMEDGLAVDIDADVVEDDIEGYITGISSRLNSGTEITIKNVKTDKEETYVLAQNAEIEVDDKDTSVISLNVGYYVEAVIGSNEIIEIEADSRGAESMIRGTIRRINTRREEVDIVVISSDLSQYAYGVELTISIDEDDTLITYRGSKGDFDDLSRNQEVLVFGYYDGYKFIVTEINVR